MSDFESRLGDALAAGAEEAPDGSGLAAGARGRARRRRRTMVVVAAVAVVAVVGVPIGVLALNDGGADRGDGANDPTASPRAPGDTRIETWHDIQIEVPASWSYGARSAWCAGGDVDEPVVERPSGGTLAIACMPSYSYGAAWVDPEMTETEPVHPSGQVWQYQAGDVAEYPPGAWLGHWYDDQDMVQVAAADKETVQEILDSVQRVDDIDGNGCPVVDDGGVGDVADDEVAVCRYSADGQLEQSERLVGGDAVRARSVVEGAGEDSRGDLCRNGPGEYVAMTVAGGRAEVQYSGQACIDRGMFIGDERRRLTSDVLYWALSPGWSGAWAGWVPMPVPLRPLSEATSAAPSDAGTEQEAGDACPGEVSPDTYSAFIVTEGPAVVCRMELSWQGESGGTFVLDRATTLTEQEAERVESEIEATPEIAGLGGRNCRGGPGELYLVLRVGQTSWVYNTECHKSGVEQPGLPSPYYREVTPELLDALGSPFGPLR